MQVAKSAKLTLSWNATNASSVEIEGLGQSLGVNGSQSIPTEDASYSIVAVADGGARSPAFELQVATHEDNECVSPHAVVTSGVSSTTTQAPANSTTAAPGKSTTAAPGNSTTAAPGNSTTAAPGNSTTAAPGSTTTAEPGSTTTEKEEGPTVTTVYATGATGTRFDQKASAVKGDVFTLFWTLSDGADGVDIDGVGSYAGSSGSASITIGEATLKCVLHPKKGDKTGEESEFEFEVEAEDTEVTLIELSQNVMTLPDAEVPLGPLEKYCSAKFAPILEITGSLGIKKSSNANADDAKAQFSSWQQNLPWSNLITNLSGCTFTGKWGFNEFKAYSSSANLREGQVDTVKLASISVNAPSGFPGVEASQVATGDVTFSLIGWDAKKLPNVEFQLAQLQFSASMFVVKFTADLGANFVVKDLGLKVGVKLTGGIDIGKLALELGLKAGAQTAAPTVASTIGNVVIAIGVIESAFIMGAVVVVVSSVMSAEEAAECAEMRGSLPGKIDAALDQYMTGVKGGVGGAAVAEGSKDRQTFISAMKQYLAQQDPPVEATDAEITEKANEVINENADKIRSANYQKVEDQTKLYVWQQWATLRGKKWSTSLPECHAMFTSIFGRASNGDPVYLAQFPNG